MPNSSDYMLGLLLAITAAFCWSAGSIFTRLGLRHIKPSIATLISMLSSLVLVGSLALLIDYDATVSMSPVALLWFVLVGFTNYVLGRQFNFRAIGYIGVARATPIFASAPLFSMILAIIFIGETVSIPIVIGTLSIIAGLSLVITAK